MKTTALIPLGLLLSAGIAEGQNLLINGSFEIGQDPNAGPSQNIGLTAPDSTTIPGWTLSNGTVDYIGSRWVAGAGVRCIDLSGTLPGTISQTIIGFTPTLSYQLNFLLASNPEGGQSTKSMEVSIAQRSQIFSVTGMGTAANLGWSPHTLDFVATAPSLTLTFASLENNAFGVALDGVGVVPVPEPGATLVCATALALWAGMRISCFLPNSYRRRIKNGSVSGIRRRPVVF